MADEPSAHPMLDDIRAQCRQLAIVMHDREISPEVAAVSVPTLVQMITGLVEYAIDTAEQVERLTHAVRELQGAVWPGRE